MPTSAEVNASPVTIEPAQEVQVVIPKPPVVEVKPPAPKTQEELIALDPRWDLRRIVTPQTPQPVTPNGDPGIGQWIPPNATQRTVVDNSSPMIVKGGKPVMVRYKTPPNVVDGKIIKVTGLTGGNVKVGMRIWLSTDPRSKYSDVPAACRAVGSGSPAIAMASRKEVAIASEGGKITQESMNYCEVQPNTLCYLGIEFDENVTGVSSQFLVSEDMMPSLS